MRAIPFDHDAIPLRASSARRLLRGSAFEVLSTDYLFVFPRALRALRRFERSLERVPAGAPYTVLSRYLVGCAGRRCGCEVALKRPSPDRAERPDRAHSRRHGRSRNRLLGRLARHDHDVGCCQLRGGRRYQPFTDAQHPPGYSALLAALGPVTRQVAVVVVVQHALGIASARLLFCSVRRLTGSPWPG